MLEQGLEKFSIAKYGVHSNNPAFLKEMEEVKKYYEFYEGTPNEDEQAPDSPQFGQDWKVADDLDYKPSKDIRNHTKKLLQKQARFMFGVSPTLVLKPLAGNKTDKVEDKRTLLDFILTKSNFWSQTHKAFLDCTIGKRVLLTIIANPGEPIKFRYYTMPEFTYEVDPNDSSMLTKVSIIYQDDRTKGKVGEEQIWHQWIYQLMQKVSNNPMSKPEYRCIATYKVTDGNGLTKTYQEPVLDDQGMQITDEVTGEPLYIEKECIQNIDTHLDFIPAYVILNDPLTGDIKGHSDVKDLMHLANHYNRTNSDYRDALRFKMFEQPVFTDADDECVSNIKIAPNALINLKSDPTVLDPEGGKTTASASMLSATFNFSAPADSYLQGIKKDMYELMDQPLPESLVNIPSAKALGFLFYDLKGRCEDKWLAWDAALQWLVEKIEFCVISMGLYPEFNGVNIMSTPSILTVKHNYPIPEDVELKKQTAISEVEANVKSHKTYIREFGDVEDEDAEWNEIQEEMEQLNSKNTDPFQTALNETSLDDNSDGEGAKNNKEGGTSLIDDGQGGNDDDSGRKPTKKKEDE